MLVKSRYCKQKEIKEMQNVHVDPRPDFHVISNGALAFAVSQILCTGKWIKLFTGSVLAFNLHFQHVGINLHEIKCTIPKSAKFWARNKTIGFRIYFLFAHDFCL
jgi:hypothetical protein